MRVLITGATNGMGKGVARALIAQPDVEIIVLGRSEERCKSTCVELAQIASAERVSFMVCDLSKLRDVRAAIDELHARYTRLDGLFVNAGLGYAPRRLETEDGMVEHFQVNYLSQFMLTLGVLDLLEASEHGGRVVFNATETGALDFDNLQLQRDWTFDKGVGVGMVAKRMFYRRLHELYAARPAPRVSCFGFQIPKTVWTNQLNIIPFAMKAMATVMKWFGQFISIDACGEIMAPLFTDAAEQTAARAGRFLTWKGGTFVDVGKNPASADPKDWETLWDVSVELCRDDQTMRCAERLTGARAS